MGSGLKVEFGDPYAGWMHLTIQADACAVAIEASCTPYDWLDEMVSALHGLTTWDGSRSMRIMEEPEVCELRLERKDGAIELHICPPSLV